MFRRISPLLGCMAILSALSGCGGSLQNAGTPSGSNASNAGGSASEGSGGLTVGDVIQNGAGQDPMPGKGGPTGVVSAQIINETNLRADVTVRFLDPDTSVHLAFVAVPPASTVQVASPVEAQAVQLFGLDELGAALPQVELIYGIDFDRDRPAEYVIQAQAAQEPPPGDDPGQGSEPPDEQPPDSGGGGPPGDTPPDEQPDEPEAPIAPTIALVEPLGNLTTSSGAALTIRWSDSSASAAAVVYLALRSTSGSGADTMLAPAIGAALDGLNDEIMVILPALEPGGYRVVARVTDGALSSEAVSPGILKIVPTDDIPPSVVITKPSGAVKLNSADTMHVEWNDVDPDDNATLVFSLCPVDSNGVLVGNIPISPPFAEDPDGPLYDSAELIVGGVLPGKYDLVATITDGELTGIARLAGIVQIQPDPENVAPQIQMLAPAEALEIPFTQSFTASWVDEDENDDARISILLDPDLVDGELNGNEILLVNGLSEDIDNTGDTLVLGFPPNIPLGTYRVLGVITDGIVTVVSAAPGVLKVLDDIPPVDDDGSTEFPVMDVSLDSDDLCVEHGEQVMVNHSFESQQPQTLAKLYLSNLYFAGGSTRIDVTPTSFNPSGIRHPIKIPSLEELPDNIIPRSFKVEFEVVVNGYAFVVVTDQTVWVRPQVDGSGSGGGEGGAAAGHNSDDDLSGIPNPCAESDDEGEGHGHDDHDEKDETDFGVDVDP